MSQYPPPYPPSPYSPGPIDFSHYAPQQADLLAPARRAAVLQAIVGSLLLVCGVCVGAVPWTLDLSELTSQSGVTVPDLPPGMTFEEVMRVAYTLIGIAGVVLGVALLVLSYFVRNGRKAPAVTSIVIEALVLIVLAINLVSALIQAVSQPLIGVMALVIVLVPIGLLGLNVMWLVSAARNASRLAVARLQQQAQYMHYEQNQHAYMAAGGYGMGYPQPGYGYAPGPQPPQQGQYPPGPYAMPGSQPSPAPQQQQTDPQQPNPSDPDVPPAPPPPPSM